MGKRTRDEKLQIACELAVALAPYLWDHRWGFGLNLYFDDVHVDYRELKSYIFSAENAENPDAVMEHFDEACVESCAETGGFDDEKYRAYREILALDNGIEMYIACEQEIYEQIYLHMWDGQPAGSGMVAAITETLHKHGMIWDLEDYSIEIYSDEPE